MLERKRHHVFLAIAVALCAATFAAAQNDGGNQNPNRDKNNAQDKNKQQQHDDRELAGTLTKATDLIGMRVEDKDAQKIGDIRNLAIHAENGHVRYAIVDSGNGKLYPIPLQAMRYQHNQKRAIVDTTAERMKGAAEFDPQGWNTIGNAQWGKIVYQFYGVDRMPDEDQKEPAFLPAGQVIGARVDSPRGESLGTLKDLAIETDKPHVAYTVLEFGNNRLFAAPWQSLNFKDGGKQVVLRGVERDNLKDAPGFPNGRWPTIKDLGWRNDTNFDSQPERWLYGMRATGGNNPDKPEKPNSPNGDDRGVMGGWQTNSAYGNLFKRNAIERIEGTVVSTEKVTPLKGMDPGIAIVVKGEGERNFMIHLGPEWFVRHQQDAFKQGERVQVNGSRVEIEGKPVIMATQLRIAGRTMTLRDEAGTPTWDAWQERK